MSTNKPLLSEVIRAVENHIENKTKYKVNYNIEIKSNESNDGKYQPGPDEFSELVYEVIAESLPWDRVTIQSFDLRILQYMNIKHKDVTLAFLVENIKVFLRSCRKLKN